MTGFEHLKYANVKFLNTNRCTRKLDIFMSASCGPVHEEPHVQVKVCPWWLIVLTYSHFGYIHHYTPVTSLLCCDNTKDWSIKDFNKNWHWYTYLHIPGKQLKTTPTLSSLRNGFSIQAVSKC